MTALKQALLEAGISPVQDRLKTIADEALKLHPRDWNKAKQFLQVKVRADAALLWALFEPFFETAAHNLLAKSRTSDPVGRPRIATKTPDISGAIAAANVAKLSLLDTFKVNGRPIGDVTPDEANRWAASRERDARFVRLLTANLPPDKPIRQFRRAEDTEALYEQAKADGETNGIA